MQVARIKLASTDIQKLDGICGEIKDIANKAGVSVAGPIPLPTKKLKVTTYRNPSGSGTGGHKRCAHYDRFEMRIHKRILDVGANERALRQIMRVQVPEGITIEIELKD